MERRTERRRRRSRRAPLLRPARSVERAPPECESRRENRRLDCQLKALLYRRGPVCFPDPWPLTPDPWPLALRRLLFHEELARVDAVRGIVRTDIDAARFFQIGTQV